MKDFDWDKFVKVIAASKHIGYDAKNDIKKAIAAGEGRLPPYPKHGEVWRDVGNGEDVLILSTRGLGGNIETEWLSFRLPLLTGWYAWNEVCGNPYDHKVADSLHEYITDDRDWR